MKMKLLNSMRVLLVAAGLTVGASASWAETGDVTTNAKFTFSTAKSDFTATAYNYSDEDGIGTIGITNWGNTTISTGGALMLGNGQGIVTIAEEERAGYGRDENRDVVTITFDLAPGKNSDKYVRFYVKDKDGANIALMEFDRYNNKFNDNGNTFGLTSAEVTNENVNQGTAGGAVSYTLTFDYKLSTMSCKTSKMDVAKTISLTNTNPVASFTISSNHNAAGRESYFDNLIITRTEGNYTIQTAKYTVQWKKEGESTPVKTDERSGDVDSDIALYGTDLQNFAIGDQRYVVLSSDVEGKTVESDGSTIVTITVRDAEKWNYTVTSSYTEDATKNTLDWSTTGWVWEDLNSAVISYPRYQAFGTTLVGRAPVSNNLQTSITVAADNYTTDLAYTSENITNLYLLKEAETLGVGTEASTSFSTRVSGGKMIYGTSGTLIKLPAGKYIFTLGVIGGENNDAKRASYVVKAGETTIAEGNCTGNFLTLISGDEFTLTGTTPIIFNATNSNGDRGIDLIYVQKTGEADLPANASVTLGKNGYTTFASAYDLDLSNLSGFKAYTAALNGVELSFAECTEKVVAGTGLLLKGTADAEVTIPVVATGAAAVADNALTGVIADTDLQSNAEGDYIFVMKKATSATDELTFAPLSTTKAVTVPAGKVYVSVPATAFSSTSRILKVSFSGETTGISSVEGISVLTEGIYNLNGQRVAQPQHGLYIVNGKKVIIK